MPGRYVAPAHQTSPFTCPHCETLSPQSWDSLKVTNLHVGYFTVGRCETCGRPTLWEQVVRSNGGAAPPSVTQHMRYPPRSQAPSPNDDLPDEIKADYVEAATILAASPRGAAALLRLCVQKMCVHLGEPGKNINNDIGALVAKGKLYSTAQRAMDTVRIAGNNAAHPGELQLEDDSALVLRLFTFVNLLAQQGLTDPRVVDETFGQMPEGARNAVARRDGTADSYGS